MKDRLVTTLRFMASKAQASDIFEEFERIVVDAYADGDARGLDALRRDIGEWSRAMSPEQIHELDAILCGMEIGGGVERIEPVIADILARRKIADEDEFRLVLERVDRLTQAAEEPNEIRALNKMLLAFESSQEE